MSATDSKGQAGGPADSLQVERIPLLLARGLPKMIGGYYKIVDQSDEATIPAKRVLKIERLEPLGLAIQMYCVYLRSLECNKDATAVVMKRAWRTLELTPEVRDDVAAEARQLYDQMLAYSVFRSYSTIAEMIEERCASFLPDLAQAPELRAYVASVTTCFDTLQKFSIT